MVYNRFETKNDITKEQKRIIIPIRQWDNGKIVVLNKRTAAENWEEFGIKKYFLTPSYQKSMNIYGVWENKETIQRIKRLYERRLMKPISEITPYVSFGKIKTTQL